MTIAELYEEMIELPRAIRFPIELIPPEGFDPEDPATWPKTSGRLEYVQGRLLYMPPCADVQQYIVADVVRILTSWVAGHPEFVVGTNEAGMHLNGATRAADAAVWRRADVGAPRGKLQRVPPLLAVEVAGEEEDEQMLREKARWYLDAGVQLVWLVLPDSREVVAISSAGEQRCGAGTSLPAHAALPDLTPRAGDFFQQLSAGA